jgi:ferredoxin
MAKYHIVIDRDACVGDKLCSDKAPDVFISDEEGKPIITDENTKWPDNILWIARNCPVDAVSIYDTETGEKVWPKD